MALGKLPDHAGPLSPYLGTRNSILHSQAALSQALEGEVLRNQMALPSESGPTPLLAEGQREAALSLSRMKGLRLGIPGADTRGAEAEPPASWCCSNSH